MRVLDHVSRLMTVDLDHLLAQVGNPDPTITQLIVDIEQSIIELRRETAAAVARQSRLRQRLFAAEEAARGVELQATLALRRGEERRARQILGRSIGALKSRDILEVELAAAGELSARLVAALIRMEERAQAVRRKRFARGRRAAGTERRSEPSQEVPAGPGAFDGGAEIVAPEAREPRLGRPGSSGARHETRAATKREDALEGGGRC